MNISVEKTPRQKLSKYVIDNADYISVTHLENTPLIEVATSCIDINNRAGCLKTIPHIAVRNIATQMELINSLNLLHDEGIENVLLIGGNRKHGLTYQKVSQVFTLVNFYNFEKLCAIYPQKQKQQKEFAESEFLGGITQLCFDIKSLKPWIDAYPNIVRIGVPSHCSTKGLIRYLKMCGLFNGLKYSISNLKGIQYLNKNKFDTKKFCDKLGTENIHIYNFGNLTETMKQLKNE